MTPRENLLSLLRREGYERAPVDFNLCPSLEATYRAQENTEQPYAVHFDFPWRSVGGPRLPKRDVDYTVYYDTPLKDGASIDAWGIVREPGSEAAKHMTHMRHPLEGIESPDQIQDYPFPPFEEADTAHMAGETDAIHAKGYAAKGHMACTIWETAWYLRSMEELMMDMMSEDEKAALLLDRVTALACIQAEAFARAGVDVLHLGDDIGMQQTTLMSPDLYRTWLKPRLAQVIQHARAIKPDILIFYHSCGFVIPFIEDLIEVGVNILNPIQPECMDFESIHAQFGDRLSFHGTIGTQTTMPFGSPDDVRTAVTQHLEIAGDKGGLFCAPTHMLEPEVPWENVLAYVDACRSFATAGV